METTVVPAWRRSTTLVERRQRVDHVFTARQRHLRTAVPRAAPRSRSTPAAVSQFAVSVSFANPDIAGTTGTVTVTAEDPFGNPVGSGSSQYVGTVNLVSTDGQAGGLPGRLHLHRRRCQLAYLQQYRSEDGGKPDDHRHRLRHKHDQRQRRLMSFRRRPARRRSPEPRFPSLPGPAGRSSFSSRTTTSNTGATSTSTRRSA